MTALPRDQPRSAEFNATQSLRHEAVKLLVNAKSEVSSSVRSACCYVPSCTNLPIDCAHVHTETDRDMGLKASDCWAISLCRQHHIKQHQIGETAFEKRHCAAMRNWRWNLRGDHRIGRNLVSLEQNHGSPKTGEFKNELTSERLGQRGKRPAVEGGDPAAPTAESPFRGTHAA